MPCHRDGFVLALGGGAGLGWAHIGVLSVLAEAGVPIAGVAGTSVGALVGACLAFDRLDVLEDVARSATRRRIASYFDVGLGSGAVLRGGRIMREIASRLGDRRIEDSPLPLSLVAADLASGKEVRIRSGCAVRAIMASMAIPGLFPAVRTLDGMLVDGGLVANVPMGAARDLVADAPMIAIDLMSDYAGHAGGWSSVQRGVVGSVRSSYLVMVAHMTAMAKTIHAPEIVIDLPIGHIATGDFTRADELIATGRIAGTEALPPILALQAARSSAAGK